MVFTTSLMGILHGLSLSEDELCPTLGRGQGEGEMNVHSVMGSF